MKKNIFIILLLLIFVSCTKKNSASSSAKEISVPDEYVGIWIISNPNYSFLQIEKNGNFSIRSMSEIYIGTVEIEENKIILPYSEKFYCGPVGEFENILEIDTIFPDKKDTLFTYNENYRDLNYKTCLENSIYQFPSREKKSEVGEIYQLDIVGVEVLKINKSIVSTENVKLKFSPHLNEKQLKAEYQWPYNYQNYEKYYPLESKSGFLLKGYICFADAVTTKKDKIDDIEAPWYHVYIGGGEESFPTEAWIWGGNCLDVENLTEEEKNKYNLLFENEALQQGLIQKKDE